jgi:uncharacterized RDD family membrane protein YckC
LHVCPKAQVLNRFIAKFVDLLIVAAAGKIAPPVGWVAGLVYILIADGLPGGRSIGKRLAGLQTVIPRTREVAGFRESIIRNLPIGSAYVLFAVPYIGWALAGLLTGFEALLVVGNDRGLRLGDDLAYTQVLDQGQLDLPD